MANGTNMHRPVPVKVHFTAPKVGSTTPVFYWPEPFTISGWFECPPSSTYRAEERIRLTLSVASRDGVPAQADSKSLPFYRATSVSGAEKSPTIVRLELVNQVHPKSPKGERIEFKITGLQIHDWAKDRVWTLIAVLERQACKEYGWRVLPIEGDTTMNLNIKSTNWQDRCIDAEKQVNELKREKKTLRSRNLRLERQVAEVRQEVKELKKKGKGGGAVAEKRKGKDPIVIDSDDEPLLKKTKMV